MSKDHNNLKLVQPNTFLIGAQKCATTSVYDWLSQHPEICAPMSVKDFEYFTRPEYFNNEALLSGYYKDLLKNESVIMQGSVHYIYFEEALKRITNTSPKSKFILIVRNPIERAISAYKYAVKFNYEDLPIEQAFKAESDRLKSKDIRVLSELTYKTHGLYFEQISKLYELIDKNQLHIVLYEDISTNPEKVTTDLFKFLEVDPKFIPTFRSFNNTGKIRSKWIQKIGFGDGPIRNFFVRKVFRAFLSEEKWAKLRFLIIHANTKNTKSDYTNQLNKDFLDELNQFFKSDIESLELLLKRDLSHWK